MDVEGLEGSVWRFRSALNECHLELELPGFEGFPKGCCGLSSELLAAFLVDEGHGVFAYVSGWTDNLDQSHGWLEKEGWIVDVTCDQFRADLECVTQDSRLVRGFQENRTRRINGDFRSVPDTVGLEGAYWTIRGRVREPR